MAGARQASAARSHTAHRPGRWASADDGRRSWPSVGLACALNQAYFHAVMVLIWVCWMGGLLSSSAERSVGAVVHRRRQPGGLFGWRGGCWRWGGAGGQFPGQERPELLDGAHQWGW